MTSSIAWLFCFVLFAGQTSENTVKASSADSVESVSGVASEPMTDGGDCVTDDEGKDPLSCGRAQRTARFFDPPVLIGDLGGDPRGGEPREPEGATDVLHYFLDIEIVPEYSGPNPTAVRVQGVNTITVRAASDNLTTFTVDMHAPLTLNSVTGNVSSHLRSGDLLIITLDRTYNTDEVFQVAINYAGYPSAAGFGAFSWWIRNGQIVVATLSEPYYARTWWPCKDRLSDKATMQMHCTVPNPLKVGSNGINEGTEALSGNRTKYKWHEINPMTAYLASLAITDYEIYELTYFYDLGQGMQSMPVVCYVYSDHWDFINGEPTPSEKAGCDELLDQLEKFGTLFGPYAFLNEKYGVAETGGTGGLTSSMEHQTLSSMFRVDIGFSDIHAHELAHQWWGDDVTCGTWYDIWLNEGFASYAESLYREVKPSGGIASYWSRMNARRPSSPNARVYRSNIGSVGAIFSTNDIYNKGAWVLHMLRHVMGDSMFFQALADYRATFTSNYAITSDFASSISATFGNDLTWFTDQWVMNSGSPRYEWNYSTVSSDGQSYLKLLVRQTQNAQGFGLITMPVDIRVTTNSGSEVHRIWNDQWQENYVFPIAGVPTNVEFDEDGGIDNRNWILAIGKTQTGNAAIAPPVILSAPVTLNGPVAGQTQVVVTFSENIGSFDLADFSLVGDSTGPNAPLSVTYNSGQRRAILTFSGLQNDSYTLTLFDDDIFANGMPLDGEISTADWWDDQLLPSGDGQPGGDALLSFALLAGDANCDGAVNLDDIAPFVSVAIGDDADACHFLRSDVNNNGVVDGTDVRLFSGILMGN